MNRRAAALWVVLPAIVLFLLGALSHRDVPGVYMDAVNPDYMVTRVLTPTPALTPYWTLPGTMLAGLFPVLGQVYHGALPFYAGLPAYALFGTGVDGIRITNAWFGVSVLAACGAFLLAFRVRPALAGLVLAALALDPAFLFAFRTPFYITLLPVGLVLAGAALTERWPDRRAVALGAGCLAGLSVWGYFIFLFVLPAAGLHAFWRARRTGIRLCWLAGLVLGGSPYVLGYALILVDKGGVGPFLDFVHGTLGALAIHPAAAQSLAARWSYFTQMLWWTLFDVGPTALMLHHAPPQRLPGLKVALLLVIPALGLASCLLTRRRAAGLLLLAGYVAGVAAMVLAFGDRLWLHHVIMLIPILYCACAVALDGMAAALWPRRGRIALLVAALLLLPRLAGNAIDRQVVFNDLEQSGGVGLSSDALDRFATDAVLAAPALREHETMFFPDWGVFMPFVMITAGQIPYETGFTPDMARRVLCAGQDAVLASVADQPPERLAAWKAAVPLPSETSLYRQRDGTPVLEVTRWKASPQACP